MPHATPVVRIKGLPGIRFNAQPRINKIAAAITSKEMDMRIGIAGILASKYTPKGVAKRDPTSSHRKENQSMSLQTCGINRILASTSRIRTIGTTWIGGSTRDMLVTATIAKPKPLYPLMMPAVKTERKVTISVTRSRPNQFKEFTPLKKLAKKTKISQLKR
jgi:hypothetical protein